VGLLCVCVSELCVYDKVVCVFIETTVCVCCASVFCVSVSSVCVY